MLPGPDQIVACPRCEGLARYATLMSGNTICARVWTDGKQIAPMMPQPPAVVKCAHCKECYWLRDAKELGFDGYGIPGVSFDAGEFEAAGLESAPVDPTWEAAKHVEEPTEKEYYQAIGRGLASDPEQLKNLRILAWWQSNEPLRELPSEEAGPKAPTPPERKKNLDALAALLGKGGVNERIMQAEVLRELGEFQAAKAVLSRITARKWAWVVGQLRALCDREDSCVRVLEFDR